MLGFVDPSASTVAAAPSASAPELPTPIDAVDTDLAGAFGGTNLLWYAAAAGGSAAMALSGADQTIRVAIQEHLGSNAYGYVSNLSGYVLPLVLAPGVWLVGLALGDRQTTAAGSAAVQALAVAALSTAVLKIGVGRAYPLNGRDPNAPDRLDHPGDAHVFRPLQVWSWPFAAWPSGHAAAATSVVAALSAYYGSDELWIPFVGYPVALAIGFGMLAGDEHWASDLLGGAVLGQCIGWSIGRAFGARERSYVPPRIAFAPIFGPSSAGLAIEGGW